VPSPASAKPAVIPAVSVNAAQTVIALIAENLMKLVIVVILKKFSPLWRLGCCDLTAGSTR
jgi:hypothetical protein